MMHLVKFNLGNHRRLLRKKSLCKKNNLRPLLQIFFLILTINDKNSRQTNVKKIVISYPGPVGSIQ